MLDQYIDENMNEFINEFADFRVKSFILENKSLIQNIDNCLIDQKPLELNEFPNQIIQFINDGFDQTIPLLFSDKALIQNKSKLILYF